MEAIRELLMSLAVSFDFPILEWIQANIQNGVLDVIMPIITNCGHAVTCILLAVILSALPKTRKIGLSVFVAMALGVLICNVIMKPIIARIRPYDLYKELYGVTINLLVKTPHDWSFPSGHTIAAFEACTAIFIRNKRWGIFATIMAILISFSRLYLFVHYPTDVLFSLVAGIIFGILGCMIVDALYRKFPPYEARYLKA